MATPPTVLSNTVSPAPTPSPPAKRSFGPLLTAVLVGVAVSAVCAAATVYVLARTGRFSPRTAKVAESKPAPVATHLVSLDPLVVNLADASGTAYLKLSLVLQVADLPHAKEAARTDESSSNKAGSDESVVAARDAALAVLGRQTSDGLLAAGGKERLKAELKSAMATRDPQMRVVDVYFTDFLVQR